MTNTEFTDDEFYRKLSRTFDGKSIGEMENDMMNGINDKLDEILVTLVALEAEVRELWRRVDEQLLHPPYIVSPPIHRNRGDFDE